jgi:NAD-dependent SIR2 family protein deacetylase
MSSLKASKLLQGKKNIVILTGAGLSAGSGIPTFRGNDGLWTKKYKYCDTPEELATKEFFTEHPEVKWEWTYDFSELCKKCKPNNGHKAILQFQEYCAKNNLECTLVTQNIDNLHAQLIKESKILNPRATKEGDEGHGFTDHVNEIHGNLSYVRCSNDCTLNLKDIPKRDPR